MNCFECKYFDGEYCRLCFQIREDYFETTRKIANPEAEEYCEWFEMDKTRIWLGRANTGNE